MKQNNRGGAARGGAQGQASRDDLLLDKNKMKDLCAEICGSREALDDRDIDNVIGVLSLLTEQMVDNIVDYSCLYAQHRKSDTLEKQDILYATSKLFPDVSKEHKVKNVQLVMDQQVM